MDCEYSKMTRLTDHSCDGRTHQLVNPLRRALINSQFCVERVARLSLLAKSNFHSHLSQKVCNLSPRLARKIRQTTFLPAQTDLRPTNNLYKVAGKEFTILDIQEKIKNPLSGSQFAKLPPSTFQQIVYQIRENGSSISSISRERKKQKLKLSNHLANEQDEKTNAHATRQSARQLQPNYRVNPFSVLADLEQSKKAATLQSEKYEGQTLRSGIQAYKFRENLLSESSSRNGAKLKKKKDYKYNLFSILDEIGNNGCSAGFTGNEICAPRMTNREWNSELA